MEQFRVVTITGAKGLHGKGANAGTAQVRQEQRREEGLADASVGAGNENDSGGGVGMMGFDG